MREPGRPRTHWRGTVKDDLRRSELVREYAEADLSDVGVWPSVSTSSLAESRSW